MEWLLLFLAGLAEIAWAVGLKSTHGFTRLWPSIGTILGMIISFYLLSLAVRAIPIGTGYAVWTGIGAVGTAIFGIAFFGESKEVARLGCIALIVVGILGLRIVSK